MVIKAVIFDLDGTITEPVLDFDRIRIEMGIPADGGDILDAIERMGPDDRRQAQKVLDMHEQRAVEKSRLNPMARETIEALRGKGIFIGILTRNKRHNTLQIERKHGLKFDAIVAREDGPVKPEPSGVLRLCEEFGLDAAETMVVGDYLHDMLSAKAAGSVAVLLRTHKKADAFAKYADFTIESLDKVLEIIENGECRGVEVD